jgi:hypothetical protein
MPRRAHDVSAEKLPFTGGALDRRRVRRSAHALADGPECAIEVLCLNCDQAADHVGGGGGAPGCEELGGETPVEEGMGHVQGEVYCSSLNTEYRSLKSEAQAECSSDFRLLYSVFRLEK